VQADAALFERLRAWRLEEAQQAGQKAFYVFPDATLQRIAAARPQTLDELQAVKGVGPRKLEQYGQAVLAVTRQGAAEPQTKEQEA
jgi:ATP-dependent DNA helicase RecQ